MPIGFDKYILNSQIQLALPMDEYTGILAFDRSKNHMPFTITHAPPWAKTPAGLPYLTFDGINDYLSCPAADSVAVNYSSEDFTLAMWYNGVPSATDILLAQGTTDNAGWEWFITDAGGGNPATVSLRLNQGGGHTDNGALLAYVLSTWSLLMVTRSGASSVFYTNGVRVPDLGGALVDALSAGGAYTLYVGRKGAGNYITGSVGGGPAGPRSWNRALSAEEARWLFDSERHWFGV